MYVRSVCKIDDIYEELKIDDGCKERAAFFSLHTWISFVEF